MSASPLPAASAPAAIGEHTTPDFVAVLDFGSQYTQVIARRLRECNVFSKVLRWDTPAATLRAQGCAGIILSGGPNSVFDAQAPLPDKGIFELGVPVLGICYGLQAIGYLLGGTVAPSSHREFGHGVLTIQAVDDPLLHGLPNPLKVWNSHGDRLTQLPTGFVALGRTENSEYAAIGDPVRRFYGLQFHPEVFHTEQGIEIYRNFLYRVCGCRPGWSMAHFIDSAVEEIRATVGRDHVILGLSGGVDSSVAAALLHRAIGPQLHCVFVDNGLLRAREREAVEDLFRRNFQMDLRVADAGEEFVTGLQGVEDPEKKRKIIGNTFVRVFEREVAAIGTPVKFLAQGTLYPDVIESVTIGGNPAHTIKTHHNVGGLPAKMQLKVLEPLRLLFKDEVRRLGEELGLPKEVVWRQPFPGPGLAVRVLGEVRPEYLRVLREADAILHQEMVAGGLYYQVWQSFCVFLPVRSVGVMGDGRTYDHVIAVRVVESIDAMTANWARVPYDVLARVSTRIINEVRGVNRVVYDISSKPPATIEWE